MIMGREVVIGIGSSTGAQSLADVLFVRGSFLPRNLRTACRLIVCGILLFFLTEVYYTPSFRRADIVFYTYETYAEVDLSQRPLALWLIRLSFVMIAFGSALAIKSGCFGYATRGAKLAYICLAIWSFLLFLIHYDSETFAFTNAFVYDKLSPGVVVALGAVFMAANPSVWVYVRKFLSITLWISCIALVLGMFLMESASRAQAYRWLYEPGVILEITAFLPMGSSVMAGSKFAKFRYIPILILILTALIMQQRQMFLVLFAAGLAYLWIRRLSNRDIGARMSKRAPTVVIAVAILMIGIVFLHVVPETWFIWDSFEALRLRTMEDTRSMQYLSYFQALDLETFFFGKGHLVGRQDFGGGGSIGIDSAYLNILWIGGLPLLGFFISFAVVPVIRCIFIRLTFDDAAVVSCAFAYCVRLQGSTHPGFTVQFMIACLLFGRCIWLVKQQRLVRLELIPSGG